ncbi:hypothetical protein FEM48_ZijujUnG0090200 [Ziziphus jujuba var. spinosa]|uniref:Uncharacterized protein n=1 Tax=Ziziphus jujuba var. spinosa TaxID=714518 RepID=A0A978U8I9_ZIZJJ|nr:hypothetical protein FEM48_ZijujUnG0090200 [Ziziphus jujuba var. spinosa]
MGHLNSCMSFVSYRSRAPYDTADSIGTLLGSDASEISSLNYISSTSEKIPADQLILVPNYSGVAHIDFQSLTTCQAVAGQNNYNPDQIPTETEFIVPVRCACPSEKQAASGVTSLLTYTIYNDTGVTSIGEVWGRQTEHTVSGDNELHMLPTFDSIEEPIDQSTDFSSEMESGSVQISFIQDAPRS